jgi:hypothetical protein
MTPDAYEALSQRLVEVTTERDRAREIAVALDGQVAQVEAATLRFSSRYARLCTLRQGDWSDHPDDEFEAHILHGVLLQYRAALDAEVPA